MNPNQSRTLWLSVGMGVFAMFLIYSYSQEKKAEYDKKYGTSKRIVVAKEDILEMADLNETMVEYQEVPVDFIQPDAITEIESVVTKVAAAPIKKGEQILATKLLDLGSKTGLSSQVAPGKRAIAIPVDESRGVSKLIQPGDRIDILSSVQTGSGPNKKTEVKTIMQDVVVLATGVKITNNIPRTLGKDFSDQLSYTNLKGDTTFSSLTIEATPREAQNLVYLMTTSPSGIYLSLRNPSDRDVKSIGTSNTGSILGRTSKPLFKPKKTVSRPKPKRTRRPASKRKRKGPFVEVN